MLRGGKSLSPVTSEYYESPAPVPLPAQPSLLSRAVRGRWWLIAFCGLAVMAGGVAVGVKRSPVYTAESQLVVGRVDLQTQSLPGYVEGAKSLAAAYSRIIVSDVIASRIARQLGLTLPQVRSRLSATPIPDGTIFRISGSGRSSSDAIRFTRAAVSQSQGYLQRLQTGRGREASRAFARFMRASRLVPGLQAEVGRLKALRTRGVGGVTTADVARADARRAAAQLQAETFGQMYQQARITPSSDFKGAEVITSAASATNDRMSVTERLGFAGLCSGLLLGLALAVLVAPRPRVMAHHNS